MRRSYQTNGDQGERDEVQDVLESYVREGAQQMLAAVLEEEVNAFLGRHRYQRGQRFRGYRNVINVNYSCRPTTITFASSPPVGSCQLRSADGLGLL